MESILTGICDSVPEGLVAYTELIKQTDQLVWFKINLVVFPRTL